MSSTELQVTQQSETGLAQYNSIEIDTQIATAKQYPRDFKLVREMILETATQDKATAEQCFYSLPRRKKKDDGTYEDVLIEGESIRFAEIVLAFWGNIQTGVRTLEINKFTKTVTVQAVVWDLERNVKTSEEVTKSIGGKSGLYSDDMIIMTTKSASSQALRNAIFRAVPKVLFKSVMDQIKKKAVEGEDGANLVKSIEKALVWFEKKGIPKAKIMSYFNNKKLQEFTTEDLIVMKGIWQGIESGEFKAEDAFAKSETETKAEEALNNVEQKVVKGKKKEEAKPTEEPSDAISISEVGKRNSDEINSICAMLDGATKEQIEQAGLSDYLGIKDIAMSAPPKGILDLIKVLEG